MKKGLRNTVMSLAALLALVSCGAPTVTEEVAKQRAQEITAKREAEDFELPTKITVTDSVKQDQTLKANGQSQTGTLTLDVTLVLDLDNHYYHMEYADSTAGTTRQWCYVEGTTAYLVIEDSKNGKIYEEKTVNGEADFATSFATFIQEVYNTVLDSEYLQIDSIENTLKDSLEGAGLAGDTSSKVSYTSSAEGNLGIKAKAEIKNGTMQGASASASLSVDVAFDNYLLMNTTIITKVNASAQGVSMKIEQKEVVDFNYGVASIEKPDLSGFTKVEQ